MVHPSQQRPNYSVRRRSWSVTLRRGAVTRTFSIRPVAVGSAIGLFTLLMTAYVGATAYLVYRDDLLGAAVSRQVSMQYAYEERMAALRSEIDRLSSRHAVQTEGVEQQLVRLLEQQAVIDRRQAALDDIVARARAAGLDVATATPPASAEQEAGAPLAYAPTSIESPNVRPILSNVRASLDNTESGLSEALEVIGVAADGAVGRLSSALAPIGVEVGGPQEEDEPQGGPFIPAEGMHFVERAALVGRTLDDIDAMRHAALAMPVGLPVKATFVSSRFGYRTDPFLKRRAFHSGVDFVAAAGTTVRSTAAGVVVTAGWNGGYGKMVEVEHADGLTTRYGHLSAALVSVGDAVEAGAAIGRVGSTGRSTGAHLHYETLRGGRAVNPGIYLAAGKALRSAL